MDSIVQQAAAEAGLKQHTINGKVYSIQLLRTSAGMTLSTRIAKALGPAMGVMIDTQATPEFMRESSMFTDLAIALVRQLDELELEETCKTLLAGLSCDGQAVDYETHFAGNYSAYIQVIEYALKENFGSFFIDYLKAKGFEIPTLMEMLKPMEDSQKESSEE